jgi:outer membrane usher protein FimD/PapC
MNLIAVSVPGVRPETKVVSTTYTTKDMENRVDFTGRPSGLWVAGKYRVDVFLNNRPAASKEFIVDKAAKDANSIPREAVSPRPAPVMKPAKATRRASTRS